MVKWLKRTTLWYGAASMTFFCTVLYLSVFYRSVLHAILSILGTGIAFYLFERLFVRITNLRLCGFAGKAAVCLSLIFGILAFATPEAAFSHMSLLGFSFGWILCVGLGLYRIADTRDKRISVFLLCLGCCFIALIGWHKIGNFNPDSIYYYLISQTIGDDFGHVSLIRQYVLNTDYNISFPYFYPLLLLLAGDVWGIEMASGIPLNGIIFIYTCLLILHVSKRFTGNIWPAALLIFALSTSKSYIQEVMATCSIPLCLLLSLGCIYLLMDYYFIVCRNSIDDVSASNCKMAEEETPKLPLCRNTTIQIALIGLLAGGAMATRFDAIALLLFATLSVFILSKGCRIKTTAVCMAMALIAALPWIIYSIVQFKTPWVTDNAGTVFLVTPEPPHRVMLDSDLTLFTSPAVWMIALVKKAVSVIISMCLCAVPATVIFAWCTICCIRRRKLIPKREWVIVFMVLAYLACKTAMYILVGYPDQRYHIETVLVATFCSIILYANHTASTGVSDVWTRFSKKSVFVCIGLMLVLSSVSNFNSLKHLFLHYRFHPLQTLVKIPEPFSRLDEELTAHGVLKDNALLCVGKDALTRGQRLSMWFGRRVYTIYSSGAVPTPEKVATLLNRRPEIEFLSLSKQFPNAELLQRFLEDHYPKEELSDVYLFRVKGVDRAAE